MWKAKIGGTWFQASPGKKIFIRYHLGGKKVVPTCHPSYSRKHKIERLWSRMVWAK
jgi:hypothetical protein